MRKTYFFYHDIIPPSCNSSNRCFLGVFGFFSSLGVFNLKNYFFCVPNYFLSDHPQFFTYNNDNTSTYIRLYYLQITWFDHWGGREGRYHIVQKPHTVQKFYFLTCPSEFKVPSEECSHGNCALSSLGSASNELMLSYQIQGILGGFYLFFPTGNGELDVGD